MAADVGRERTVAFPERRDHGVPARAGVGEAVQEDDSRRHQAIRIMTATDTYLLLRAFCDELARCGMEHACTSPGSRCTPIVLSLVREPRIRCWSHIDERCAGFFALGAAKASGRPVAVTCTSGTAAANLAPAVIEARHARVPLIVLTADRPPELRDVGAGQTIDQLKLYGDAVKWFFEVGVRRGDAGGAAMDPDAGLPRLLDRGRGTARARSTSTSRCASRSCSTRPLPADRTGRDDDRPYVTVEPVDAERPARALRHPVGSDRDRRRRRTATAIGGRELAGFAARAAIPLLADPLSGARRGDAAIAHYDLLLRDPEFAAAHRPQFVIRIGDLPTSKPLRAWLAGLDAAQIAIDPDGTWHDPDARGRDADAGAATARCSTADRRRGPSGRCRAGSTRGEPPTTRPAGAIVDSARRRAVRAARGRAASASGCRPTRPCSSPPRCRSATSRSSCRRARLVRACSRTAARTGSTARSRPRSAWPPPTRVRSCC